MQWPFQFRGAERPSPEQMGTVGPAGLPAARDFAAGDPRPLSYERARGRKLLGPRVTSSTARGPFGSPRSRRSGPSLSSLEPPWPPLLCPASAHSPLRLHPRGLQGQLSLPSSAHRSLQAPAAGPPGSASLTSSSVHTRFKPSFEPYPWGFTDPYTVRH